MVALSDSSGSIVEAYPDLVGNVFGAVTVHTAYGADTTWLTSDDTINTPADESDYGNPYRFTGRRYDEETGLYYYRARMYAPAIGRFLQPDPIGYADSMNLYQYCRNNPVNYTDPWGLEAKDSIYREAVKESGRIVQEMMQSNRKSPPYLLPRLYPESGFLDFNDCGLQNIHHEYRMDAMKWEHWRAQREGRYESLPGFWRNWYRFGARGNHVVTYFAPFGKAANDPRLRPFVVDAWKGPIDSWFWPVWRVVMAAPTGGRSMRGVSSPYDLMNYGVDVYTYEEFKKRRPYIMPGQGD